MNTRQKGRRLVTWLITYFKDFDSTAYEVVGSGSGREKGDLRVPRANLIIEAKNQKNLSIKQDIKQAKRQGFNVNDYALIFRHPDSPEANPDCYAVIHLDYLLKLLSRGTESLITSQNSQEAKYTIASLKRSLNAVLKLFP